MGKRIGEIFAILVAAGAFLDIGTSNAIRPSMKEETTVLPKETAVSDTHPPALVLLVEDEEEARKFMCHALIAAGLRCVTAGSVAEALDRLDQENISAMVLDWGLDRSGSEVLQVAKELRPLLPVIVMSGLPFDVRTDAALHQADAFLQKPFSAAVLVSQVRQAIGRRQSLPSIPLPCAPEEILPLERIKQIYIGHVVELLDGSIVRAASFLGLHRHTVSAALKERSGNADSSGALCTDPPQAAGVDLI